MNLNIAQTRPKFTTIAARDLKPLLDEGITLVVRFPGRERIVMEVADIDDSHVTDVMIEWADESFTLLHGNTFVQVLIG